MVPGAESNIKRKQLIRNASLNEVKCEANTRANRISALKNRGFDSLAKPTLDLGSSNRTIELERGASHLPHATIRLRCAPAEAVMFISATLAPSMFPTRLAYSPAPIFAATAVMLWGRAPSMKTVKSTHGPCRPDSTTSLHCRNGCSTDSDPVSRVCRPTGLETRRRA